MDDAAFLRQAANQITPVLEHIRLVDRMASDAADEERRRIARSVHDRVIQPYMGLQMGLKALDNLVHSAVLHNGGPPPPDHYEKVVVALDNVMKVTHEGIEELRNYVYGLQPAERRGGGALRESLLRYAAKFEAATGIRTTVVNRIESLRIHDRLAAEIFQMVAEALSNVQRHTSATSVTVNLEEEENGCVVVKVENEVMEPAINSEFVPRSISARAEALGGYTKVSVSDCRTVVQVGIPI